MTTTSFAMQDASRRAIYPGTLSQSTGDAVPEWLRMVAIQRLGAALGTAIAGEVRFDAAARAAYASDASNYRQVPVGVVLPRTVEDVVAAVARCARTMARRSSPRGGGTSHVRPERQRGAWSSTAPSTSTACSQSIRRRARARVEPGSGVRRPARGGRAPRPYLRARPGDALALHPRRHDRQQLLRPALGDGGQDRGKHRAPGGADLRRRAFLVWPHRCVEMQRILSLGGRQGRDLFRAANARRPIRRPDPRALPADPPARLGLQPGRAAARERLQRGARAGRQRKAPAHSRCRPGAAGEKPRRRVLVVRGFADIFAAGDAVPRSAGRRADRLRGPGRRHHRRAARARAAGWPTSHCCRRARPG